MINFNTEYYSNNYYFFLKERADKISLYYSIADTLTESRKNDERIDFDKKDSKKVKNIMSLYNNVIKEAELVLKGGGDIKNLRAAIAELDAAHDLHGVYKVNEKKDFINALGLKESQQIDYYRKEGNLHFFGEIKVVNVITK